MEIIILMTIKVMVFLLEIMLLRLKRVELQMNLEPFMVSRKDLI